MNCLVILAVLCTYVAVCYGSESSAAAAVSGSSVGRSADSAVKEAPSEARSGGGGQRPPPQIVQIKNPPPPPPPPTPIVMLQQPPLPPPVVLPPPALPSILVKSPPPPPIIVRPPAPQNVVVNVPPPPPAQIKVVQLAPDETPTCADEAVLIGKDSLQWTNPNFPLGEGQGLQCSLRIKRDPGCWTDIAQIKVIAQDFHLTQPIDGRCLVDNLTITGNDKQGQKSWPALALCGEEPEDFILVNGRKYPQNNHLYFHFKHDMNSEIVLTMNLSPSRNGRRWKLLIKPIEWKGPDRAPFGCSQYFYKTIDDTENYYKVIRSWNYPKSFKSGTITNQDFGVCFGSASPDSPIKSVIVSPNRGGFDADAFNVGRIPGENEARARHDAACALTNHLLMPSPSTPSVPVRYCGGRFNPLDLAPRDAPATIKTGGFYRIDVYSGPQCHRGGFRFLWNMEGAECPKKSC